MGIMRPARLMITIFAVAALWASGAFAESAPTVKDLTAAFAGLEAKQGGPLVDAFKQVIGFVVEDKIHSDAERAFASAFIAAASDGQMDIIEMTSLSGLMVPVVQQYESAHLGLSAEQAPSDAAGGEAPDEQPAPEAPDSIEIGLRSDSQEIDARHVLTALPSGEGGAYALEARLPDGSIDSVVLGPPAADGWSVSDVVDTLGAPPFDVRLVIVSSDDEDPQGPSAVPATDWVNVKPQRGTVSLQLPLVGTLARLPLKLTGADVSGGSVHVGVYNRDDDGSGYYDEAELPLDADGNVQLWLAPGEYRLVDVRWFDPLHHLFVAPDNPAGWFDLQPGENAKMPLAIPGTARADVRVAATRGGQPFVTAPPIQVWAVGAASDASAPNLKVASVDAGGSLKLYPGKYRLGARYTAPDGTLYLADQTVLVQSGADVAVQVAFQKAATLVYRGVALAAQPLADVPLRVMSYVGDEGGGGYADGTQGGRALTTLAGAALPRLALGGQLQLLPGQYLLLAGYPQWLHALGDDGYPWQGSYPFVRQIITLNPGQRLEWTAAPWPQAGALHVHLTSQGAPLPAGASAGVRATLGGEGQASRLATHFAADVSGAEAQFAALPAGPVQLDVAVAGANGEAYGQARVTAEVVAGRTTELTVAVQRTATGGR